MALDAVYAYCEEEELSMRGKRRSIGLYIHVNRPGCKYERCRYDGSVIMSIRHPVLRVLAV